MIALSILGALAGIFAEPIYTNDWWSPTFFMSALTPFGPFGLADAIFGWSMFGIASVSGELFKPFKEEYPRRVFYKSFFISQNRCI